MEHHVVDEVWWFGRPRFAANRRLLDVQRISHDCPVGQDAFVDLHRPAVIDSRRVSAVRLGAPRIQAMLAVMLLFVFLPMGFSNRKGARTRPDTALCRNGPLWCQPDPPMTCAGCACTGLIERLPQSHRYRVTERRLRVALCYCRVYRRALNPALAAAETRAHHSRRRSGNRTLFISPTNMLLTIDRNLRMPATDCDL